MHSLSARGSALTASSATAVLQLAVDNSIAYSAAGPGALIDAVNVVVLLLCFVGWIDVIYHDIFGRLIWPSMPKRLRHLFCVGLYSALGGSFAMRAFVAAGVGGFAVASAIYYVMFAVWITVEAAALARESRE